MKNPLIAFLACAVTAGCAQKPDEISAAYVSPTKYENTSCSDIAAEAQRVSARQASLTGQQQKQASDDAAATTVGIILFWPVLFMIDGDDETATELSRMKGEFEALRDASERKGCKIRFGSAADNA